MMMIDDDNDNILMNFKKNYHRQLTTWLQIHDHSTGAIPFTSNKIGLRLLVIMTYL